MFVNNTDKISAMEEVALYCTTYQFSEQFVTVNSQVRLYSKSGPTVHFVLFGKS